MNHLKKCMKPTGNWNFQRGGNLEKNLFCGRGMDIFWNYTIADNTCSLQHLYFTDELRLLPYIR